jgi:DNA polymerase-1
MIKTLLIDGDNLFKISFHGVKDLYHDGEHIGGIFHFINVIRKFLHEHNFDKVIVCWDSTNSNYIRREIYPDYKNNRKVDINEFKLESYENQKERVKQYLEEVFVRQIECVNNEADDLIAYYCSISKNENIVIFSGDKDLTQLISSNVSIYSPINKTYYKFGDKIFINKIGFHHDNVLICKVFTGDKSDNISGIENLGEKTLIKLFPELSDRFCSIEELLEKTKILSEKKKLKVINNILTGKTKYGIFGDEIYSLNKKIVDLKNPIITEDGKLIVNQIYSDTIDPTNRGYKNLMRFMIEDGLFNFLPKNDDAWVEFFQPFTKLIRKEKRNL